MSEEPITARQARRIEELREMNQTLLMENARLRDIGERCAQLMEQYQEPIYAAAIRELVSQDFRS
jgi:hypothetical protein